MEVHSHGRRVSRQFWRGMIDLVCFLSKGYSRKRLIGLSSSWKLRHSAKYKVLFYDIFPCRLLVIVSGRFLVSNF